MSYINPVFPQIDAILFDCDGVLVDTEYLKFLAWKEVLQTRQIDFVLEEYIPLIGHNSKNMLKSIQQNKGVAIDEAVLDDRRHRYTELQEQGVQPIPQMVELVRKLKAKSRFKLGLTSSASRKEILINLRQMDLEGLFDLILSGSDDLDAYVDAEGKNKPKPYIYLEAAKRLSVDPSRCLVFEDTTAGIEAASGAGMIAIAVPNRFTLTHDFSKAYKIILSYQQLNDLSFLKT